MPKLLFLTPITPCPTGNGLAMRAWAIMQGLSSLGSLRTVVIPVAESAPYAQLPDGAHRAAVVEPVTGAASWLACARGRALLEQVPNLPKRARLAPPAYGEDIHAYDGGSGYDLVYILRLYLAGAVLPLMDRLPRTRLLMDIDETDHTVMQQIAVLQEQQGQVQEAHDAYAEAERLLRFATHTLQWFDLIACSSELEAGVIKSFSSVPAFTLPNVITPGNDVSQYSARQTFSLLFLGNLDYWPNRDAVFRLLTNIFPRVRQEVAGAELMIAGHGAIDLRTAHGEDEAVHWLGFVEDLSSLYRKASVCVVPLRAGGGSRLKVLEAFDRGVPVVATAKAMEGLAVAHGNQALLGESDDALVAAVLSIARDSKMAFGLAQRARKYVRIEHAPIKLKEKLHALVSRLLER